ncbi:hypothetical protein [Mesobacillus jeotgali]|uniref:2TM domain-containing protein n=1 Tax=Mesobacillus jeotgali TaxID=129985 RepID=A0ABY9VIB6_9BACI|nr:hypothetical protein [Mesobacillus jeotgali]WNF23403.1 hypothetical protein RH061_02520 [Mesobacillus jeotgali]
MNFIAWMIVACEIAFWVVIILGLTIRYVFKKKRLSIFFLALTPVIDLLLLALTSYDLYRGATATIAHGIAAIYIGVSVAYGKSMIDWADSRFRYYILKKGEKPERLRGKEFSQNERKNLIRHYAAFLIGGSMLGLIIFLIKDPAKTESLFAVLKTWGFILAIDTAITASYFIWPKKDKATRIGS